MEQYTESQYDDDLTVGVDEYGDSFETSEVDLFEFGGDEDSQITRLKTLVLSIDWEISDEILLQFNEEIVDLKDVWAGEKINLVYLQALEKISKYIYRDKADANPNAIKLLLSLYYNLEKIVSSDELSEEEKKKILLEDVQKFEHLKRQISKTAAAAAAARAEQEQEQEQEQPAAPEAAVSAVSAKPEGTDSELIELKAIVLGIDWEVTDNDLLALRREVALLEDKYSGSRPKLILLQGIGTLGAYIRHKKSNAHADAFKLLHAFFESLEKIAMTSMSLEEEKEILFPIVDKFNTFKELIGATITPEAISKESKEPVEEEEFIADQAFAPAFADIPEEEVRGFQEEEEVAALGIETPANVDAYIDDFFGDEGEVAALSPATPPAELEESVDEEAESISDAFFGNGEIDGAVDLKVDKETALKGVDVETEADDDSDEEALPLEAGKLAPALADSSQISTFSEDSLGESLSTESMSEEINGRLDGFFTDEAEAEAEAEAVVEPPAAEDTTPFDVPADIALQGVDVEAEGDEDEEQEDLLTTPALAEFEEEPDLEDFAVEPMATEEIEDESEMAVLFEKDDIAPAFADIEDDISESETLAPELTSAFSEAEEVPFVEAQTVEEELQIDEQLDSFFVSDEKEELVGEEPVVEAPEAEIQIEEPEPEAEDIAEDIVDEFAVEVGEGALLTSMPAETEAPPAFALSEDEEEVVFELVEDDVLSTGEEVAVTPVEEPTETYLTEVIEEAGDEDRVEGYTAVFEAAEEETVAEPVAVTSAEAIEEVEPLADLQDCIGSLGLELEDSILQGLFAEINSLRQRWVSRPVEKSYLQLLSTIGQHIDQYRYEASAEAHGLLIRVFANLRELQELDMAKAQELLLEDTYKVLQWQQNMLNRQAVRKGSRLTFIDPIRSEETEERSFAGEISLPDDSFEDEFTAVFDAALDEDTDETSAAMAESEVEEGQLIFEDALADMEDYEITAGEEDLDMDLEEALNREVEQAERSAAYHEEPLSDIIRSELESIRRTLKDEIAALRKEIKGSSEK